MNVFDFAQNFILTAFGAAATWIMHTLNTIGAAGFVSRMFFIAVTCSMLILPLRGAAISAAASDQVRARKERRASQTGKYTRHGKFERNPKTGGRYER